MTWLAPLKRRRTSAYGAGPRLDHAIAVCRRLASYRLGAAIGYAASPDESARDVGDAQLAAIDRLSTEGLDCYLSLKLSALGFDAALFAELVSSAARSGQRLHIDALAPETVDVTLALLEQAPRDVPLGITLPGRWRRSVDDVSRLVGRGLRVRVVKGQWTDDDRAIVDPARGFLQIVDRLQGHQGGVAVATHDVRLLRESLRRLTGSGTPCEAELFLGMPFRGPAVAARQLGVPVRVYVPYGDTGSPYRLTSHPAAALWLAQDLVLGEDKTWRSIRRSRTQR